MARVCRCGRRRRTPFGSPQNQRWLISIDTAFEGPDRKVAPAAEGSGGTTSTVTTVGPWHRPKRYTAGSKKLSGSRAIFARWVEGLGATGALLVQACRGRAHTPDAPTKARPGGVWCSPGCSYDPRPRAHHLAGSAPTRGGVRSTKILRANVDKRSAPYRAAFGADMRAPEWKKVGGWSTAMTKSGDQLQVNHRSKVHPLVVQRSRTFANSCADIVQ